MVRMHSSRCKIRIACREVLVVAVFEMSNDTIEEHLASTFRDDDKRSTVVSYIGS